MCIEYMLVHTDVWGPFPPWPKVLVSAMPDPISALIRSFLKLPIVISFRMSTNPVPSTPGCERRTRCGPQCWPLCRGQGTGNTSTCLPSPSEAHWLRTAIQNSKKGKKGTESAQINKHIIAFSGLLLYGLLLMASCGENPFVVVFWKVSHSKDGIRLPASGDHFSDV